MSNRGYSYLVVGASDDKDSTTLTDDEMAGFSSWRNPDTTHDDHELPSLVAPGTNIKVGSLGAGGSAEVQSGTSLAAPFVSGVAALVTARDTSTFYGWPEMLRAVLQAAAVQTPDGQFTKLGSTTSDTHQGAGGLNAHLATLIAASTNYRGPSTSAAQYGRYNVTAA